MKGLGVFLVISVAVFVCHGFPFGVDRSRLRDYAIVQPTQPTHPVSPSDLGTRITSHNPSLHARYASPLATPHVESTTFSFEAFGSTFTVPLRKSNSIFHKNFQSYIPNPQTNSLERTAGLEDCFYQQHPSSSGGAFFSTCHGALMGFFETSDGDTMVVEPLVSHESIARGVYAPHAHIVYRTSDLDVTDDGSHVCGVREDSRVPSPRVSSQSLGDAVARRGGNHKRFAGPTAHLSQLMILDETIYQQFGLTSTSADAAIPALVYGATLFGVTSYYYDNTEGLDIPIQLSLKTILLWDTSTSEITAQDGNGQGRDWLDAVTLWQSENKAVYNMSNTALFTTRTIEGPGVAGLAFVAVQCQDNAVSLNRNNGGLALAAIVFAHELGHNWALNHDDPSEGYIMNAGVAVSENWGAFSTTSRDTLNAYIAAEELSCLSLPPSDPAGLACAYPDAYFPGKCFTPKQTCEFISGDADATISPTADCEVMLCGGIFMSPIVPPDGSPCTGDGAGQLLPQQNFSNTDQTFKMCINQQCVDATQDFLDLDCDQCLTEDPLNGFRGGGGGDGDGEDFPVVAGVFITILLICYVCCAIALVAIAVIAIIVGLVGAGGFSVVQLGLAENVIQSTGVPHGGDTAM